MRDPPAYDVVIVGGGVIGSAVAYFLAASGAFSGSILVVERDPSYREGSTARSVGGIRQQYSTPENIEIARFGVHFLEHVDAYLAIDGEVPAVSFRPAGYLFLATAAGCAAARSNHALQRAHGARTRLLAPAALARRFPWLNVDDLALGSFGERGEGWFDPHALHQGFRRKARRLGALFLGDEVIAVARSRHRVTGIGLASGRRVACGVLVNAAGPRAREVAAMAGVDLCVRPRKRQVFAFSCPAAPGPCPLVVDPSGLYFRPEGGGFICGMAPDPLEDPDCLDLEVDYGQFERALWPRLAHRVPAFEAIRMARAWAGHYAYNTFDQNAIVGPHSELDNFILANGFSGHGLQQSPAVGRAVAELIATGRYQTIDLTRLGHARIAGGRPLREQNVV